MSLSPMLSRLGRPALVAGGAALLLCLVGWIVNPPRALAAYLGAYLFFLGLALGSNAMLMVHELVGGRWGTPIRRFEEAAAASLPLLALLFLPVLVGASWLYPWASAGQGGEWLVQYRRGWLNLPFFAVRAMAYFAIWTGMALLMRRWGRLRDTTGRPDYAKRLAALSAGGLIVYVFTASFAAVDWVMSRETHWFSTIIGFVLVTGQALSGLALVVLLLTLAARREPRAGIPSRQVFNDLGNLLFTLVILFAYMSFVQFLIQWYGNLQDDTVYYARRIRGGWGWVGVVLIVFHFFVPFFLLLSRFNKQHVGILGGICGLLLVMRLVDSFWWVVPSGAVPFGPLHLAWTCLTSVVAIGGIWLSGFARQLAREPAVGEVVP
jgi:hypothetical protein